MKIYKKVYLIINFFVFNLNSGILTKIINKYNKYDNNLKSEYKEYYKYMFFSNYKKSIKDIVDISEEIDNKFKKNNFNKKLKFLNIYKNIEKDSFLNFIIFKMLLLNDQIIMNKLEDYFSNKYEEVENYNINFYDLYKYIYSNKYIYNKDIFLKNLEFFKENDYYKDLIGKIRKKLNENNFKKVETFLLEKGKKSFNNGESNNKLYYDQINLLSILRVIDEKEYDDFIKEKIGYIFPKNKRERSNSETFI